MKKLAIAAFALFAATGAEAATIDFVTFGAGQYGSSIVVDGVTITNTSGGNILVGAGSAGQSNGFCSLNPSEFTCEADTEIDFGGTVSDLSFWIDGSNSGDSLLLSLFGVGNVFLGDLNFTTPDQFVDLSAFGDITRLVFDDSSSAAGYGYSRFDFTNGIAPIPLPGSLPLLVGAIGLVGLLRRRKSA